MRIFQWSSSRNEINALSVRTISRNDLVADETEISKQLVIMSLAVSEALLLVMTMTQERLLAFGAYEMLHVPMLAECCYHALFDGTSTSTANRDSHFIVASQAVQFILYVIQYNIDRNSYVLTFGNNFIYLKMYFLIIIKPNYKN